MIASCLTRPKGNVVRRSPFAPKYCERSRFNTFNMAIGDYPIEYDPKIHGPYDPARYYGKPDTPFGQVKLGELGAWFGRRNKGPRAIVGSMSRAFWRWQHNYILPKRSGVAPMIQATFIAMAFFYVINFGRIKQHRNYKYH